MGTNIPNIGLGATGDSIGKVVVEIIADDKAYQQGLKKSEKALGLFDKKTQKIAGKAGKAFLAGGAAIGTALAGVVFHAARAGDELDKMSLRTGESVENLSRLGFAANISGTSLQAVEGGIRRLTRNMNDFRDGTGEAAEAFERLGIDVMAPTGELRTSLDVITEVADKINALGSEAEKTALSQELFGRSGANLLPLLKQGSAGIQELMDRADELGIVMSTDAASASAEFTDRMLELTESFKMAGFELGQALLPEVQKAVELFTKGIAEFNKLDEGTKKTIAYGAAVSGLFAIFTGTGLLVVSRLDALTKGFKVLGPAITSVPFATAATGALAFAASLWAVKQAQDALDDPLNNLKGQLKGLSLANEGFITTINTIEQAMNDAESQGIDPLSASMADLGIDIDDLNEKLNTSPAFMDKVAGKAEDVATILGGLFGQVGPSVDTFDAAMSLARQDIEAIISPTDNAADTLDKLKERAIAVADEASRLKDEIKDVGEEEKTTTESTKNLNTALKNLQETMEKEIGETFFLRVFPEVNRQARELASIDIEPRGLAEAEQNARAAAKEFKELGDRIQESGEQIGIEGFDAQILIEGQKEKGRLQDEQLGEEERFRAEISRIIDEQAKTDADRIAAGNLALEKAHESAIQAGIELSDKQLDEARKTGEGIFKLQEQARKEKKKADQKVLDDAIRDQEQAAADTLAAWQDVTDDIEDSFVDLFETVIRDGKADWAGFVEDIGDLFIGKFAELAVDKTVTKFLDKIIENFDTEARPPAGRDQTSGDIQIKAPSVSVDQIKSLGGGDEGPGPVTAREEPPDEDGDSIFTKLASIPALAVLPAALPVFGAIAQNVQEKQRFREQREALRDRLADLQFSQGFIDQEISKLVRSQNKEFADDIDLAPRPTGRSILGNRISRVSDRAFPAPGRAAPASPGTLDSLGGDTYFRIDRLELNMPPTIKDMSRAELDEATSRQIDSFARAVNRSPRARRRMRR